MLVVTLFKCGYTFDRRNVNSKEMEGMGMINDTPVHQESRKLWQYLASISGIFVTIHASEVRRLEISKNFEVHVVITKEFFSLLKNGSSLRDENTLAGKS